jgi:hypothetical protein
MFLPNENDDRYEVICDMVTQFSKGSIVKNIQDSYLDGFVIGNTCFSEEQ